MTSPLSTRLVTAALLAAIATTLGSCGRKGPLEPEPGSVAATAKAAAKAQADEKGTRPPPPPPRPFLLDPLL